MLCGNGDDVIKGVVYGGYRNVKAFIEDFYRQGACGCSGSSCFYRESIITICDFSELNCQAWIYIFLWWMLVW